MQTGTAGREQVCGKGRDKSSWKRPEALWSALGGRLHTQNMEVSEGPRV